MELIEGDDRGVFEWQEGGNQHRTRLRSSTQISEFWSANRREKVFLDITGLSHSTWAPLLRGGLKDSIDIRVVYAEPVSYSQGANPTEGEFFDLSERIGRIEPLPGFASLTSSADEPSLIVLLGFEGNRFHNLQEQVQAPAQNIYPVIGVPGFRIEYPLNTFFGNRLTLRETRSWQNAHFVRADCPFSAYYLLQDLSARIPAANAIRVAPLGTKPHAVAAVLFALSTDRLVELVYDHPKRNPGRTTGAARIHVYHVAALPLLDSKLRQLVGDERDLVDRRAA